MLKMSQDASRTNYSMPTRQGVKRLHTERQDAPHVKKTSIHSNAYANGWMPPGHTAKRKAQQELIYAGAHKLPRVDPHRSYSTSFVVPVSSFVVPVSSLASSLPSSSTKVLPNLLTNGISGQRSMSASEAELRTYGRKETGRRRVLSSTCTQKANKTANNLTCNANGLDGNAAKARDVSKASKTGKKELKVSRGNVETTESSKSKMNLHTSEENSRNIWSFYMQNKQTDKERQLKERMRYELQECIREIYPSSILILGGSSLNGFGSRGCDADLCVYLTDSQLSQPESRQILLKVRTCLQYKNSNVSHVKVIFAKVPILKFLYKSSALVCDLNVNHLTGVCNTALLRFYSKLDWRVAPLIILIKQWAKNHGINDASQGTLSSYSYVLMIINYLQVGCVPPVLLSIQRTEWGKQLFPSQRRSIFYWLEKLYGSSIPQYSNQSSNTQDLYSLLKGFFAYYANFDFENTVISVRLGSCFPRSHIPLHHHGWKQKYIFIEEPFEEINTARSVFDWSRFQQIVELLQEAHEQLCKSQNLDVDLFLNLR